nr:rhabdomeric opsin [Macrobiotus joannae]
MFCGAYVAPLSAITICYLFIVWEVFAHSRKFKKAATKLKVTDKKGNEEVKSHKKEVKTAKIAAIIIGCWSAAWTPYAVVALMGIATDGSYLTPIASQLPALFAKSAAVYNPIGATCGLALRHLQIRTTKPNRLSRDALPQTNSQHNGALHWPFLFPDSQANQQKQTIQGDLIPRVTNRSFRCPNCFSLKRFPLGKFLSADRFMCLLTPVQ